MTRLTGTLNTDQCTFVTVSCSVLLRMRNISGKIVEKIKTHILSSIFSPWNPGVYEMMWKNTAEPDKPQMTVWRMHIACWISEASNTHTNTHTHTHLEFLLLVHCNSGCTNAPQCYVCTYSTLPVSLRMFQEILHVFVLNPHSVLSVCTCNLTFFEHFPAAAAGTMWV